MFELQNNLENTFYTATWPSVKQQVLSVVNLRMVKDFVYEKSTSVNFLNDNKATIKNLEEKHSQT